MAQSSIAGKFVGAVVGIGWVVGSFVIWLALWWPIGVYFDYLGQHKQPVDPGVEMLFVFIANSGSILVTAVTAVLAMRGKLPGTRARLRASVPGFEPVNIGPTDFNPND